MKLCLRAGVSFVVACGLTGCVTDNAKPQFAPASRPAERAPVAPTPTVKDMETLAAVEDFLERTGHYRLGQPAVPPSDLNPTDAPTIGMDSPAKGKAPAPPQPDKAFANTQVILPETTPPKPILAIPAVLSVSVHSPDPTTETRIEPHPGHATNAPLNAQPADAMARSDELLAQLRSQVNAKKDFESEWQLRLAELAFDRDAQAMAVSSHLGERTQALMTAFMPTAVGLRDVARDPLSPVDAAIARIDQLRETIAKDADPVVSTVVLCRKVTTFGSYEEMPAEDFVAGRTTQTIVYSEIANLQAEKTASGTFETRLGSRLEVLTAEGKSVWQREEPEIVDTCRQRRDDFFIAQRITLPPTLPVGDYVLKVFVEDKKTAKADESAIPFSIVAPIAVAKSRS